MKHTAELMGHKGYLMAFTGEFLGDRKVIDWNIMVIWWDRMELSQGIWNVVA